MLQMINDIKININWGRQNIWSQLIRQPQMDIINWSKEIKKENIFLGSVLIGDKKCGTEIRSLIRTAKYAFHKLSING